ncbi:PHB depolymerase family esterase [Streptomyces sp. H27-C3]|uniref:alpha/beta hydrolase family esterase n=1 Tax=Streptomyces sp. H27-C3 TaxID=3046305 RepID=UPI0024BAF79B|nr:PHB depolymerase family esterase [Streptomyces sp. H27-C3]MDJ0466701.1 PHB depolymerase family esterase [Streptomyces sp. H27-C3]
MTLLPSSPHRRTTRSRYGALLLGVLLAAGPVGCTGAAEPPTPRASASVSASPGGSPDGGTREYLLHRPAGGAGPRPLVIAFHGRGSGAEELRGASRLEKAAGARGMLVAYPEGLRDAWGAGSAVTKERPDPDADVRFAEALVGELVRTGRADPERVYAAGFSNGGAMALRVAAQRPGPVAGAAAVSGQLPAGRAVVRPTGAVPVLIIYGEKDPVRPLGGLLRPGPAPAGEEPITPTMSARDSAAAFAAAGGARGPVTKAEAGYDRTVWGAGPAGATVQLLVMDDAGHTWPGSSITPPKGFGRTSTALNAAGTVVDFFAAQQ